MSNTVAFRPRVTAAVTAVLAAALGAAVLTAPAAGAATVPAASPNAHDFNGNGTPDLLQIDRAGTIHRYDTSYDAATGKVSAKAPVVAATDWPQGQRITATGNLGGSSVGDVVAKDYRGVLRLYKGRGDGGFDAPVDISKGWHAYNIIVGGGDVTGDGKPDLLGVGTDGSLWYHTGTGNGAAPFAPARKQAGPSGWGVYWSFALGDFAGGKAADIVAVDSRGDLWLHQGKGDGTFANRTKVGRGWHVYESVLNVGDADRDGKADLMGFTRSGTAAFYKGTHDAAKPFGAARPVPLNAISDPWVDGFYF
ncbi:FG-GAP-like repeat-containing protein [Streptomyces sp. NPDC000963]